VAKRVDELAEEGDLDGAAVWRRIMQAVAELANTTPSGPVNQQPGGAASRLSALPETG
jgi:hypothetical protein